jgi:hypothetical protein
MEQIYNTIDKIVAAQKKARANNDFLGLMVNAEALLEYLPSLINHSVDSESEYRKYEAGIINERDDTGKRYTSSYCETMAKATDYYKAWQKAKQFIELMYEMVNLSKKLAGTITRDENNG